MYDKLRSIETRIAHLNTYLLAAKRDYAQATAAPHIQHLTGAAQKKIREEADWAQIKATQGVRAEILIVVDELCNLYRRATAEEREHIRSLMVDKPDVLSVVMAYTYKMLERFNDSQDIEYLRLGLASICIEDARLDFRDTLVVLGHFYLALVQHKIDPQPYFREAAAMSNAEDSTGIGSTQSIFHNFTKSAYFTEAVRPKLKRLWPKYFETVDPNLDKPTKEY